RHTETRTSDTATEDSNVITGASTVLTATDHTSDSRTTTTNLPLVVVETAHEHVTGTATDSGNAIRGNAHVERSRHTDFDQTSDQTNQTLHVVVTEAGSSDETVREDSEAVLGWSILTSHADGECGRDEAVTHTVGAVAVTARGEAEVVTHSDTT